MDAATLLDLAIRAKWLALFAVLIGLVVRALKEDTVGPVVPPRARPWLALGLGAVAATLDKVLAGASWKDAAILGLGAPVLAILGHVLGIESLRNDKEFPLPWLMKKGGMPVVGGLLIFLVALVPACSARLNGVPVLSTIDAVGRGVSHVLGWCEERGIDPGTVQTAKQAVVDRDYGTALEIAKTLVQKSRAAGDPIPEQTEVLLRLAEGALAAQAVQDGMRALSSAPAK